MPRNWYSEVIDILHSDVDFKKIVIELAKKHPKAVVTAAEISTKSSWQDICRSLRESKGLIHAIKKCRELTGMGLMEAKAACETL